jgi:hypothetical protein
MTGAHSEDGNIQRHQDLVEHPITRNRANIEESSLSMTAELSNHSGNRNFN